MPFVIRFADGTYLKRSVNSPGNRERERTGNLEEATTWSRVGHAKTALVAAVENDAIQPTEAVDIVEIMYSLKRFEGRYRTKVTKGRRQAVLVDER
jgi:hypothetical protein